jgi:hypothetical protein
MAIDAATRAVMRARGGRMAKRRIKTWKRQLHSARTFWEWYRAVCHLRYLKYGKEISITEFHYQLQRAGEMKAAFEAGRYAQWNIDYRGDDPD